jgi:small-conductance mechanosensitive channel
LGFTVTTGFTLLFGPRLGATFHTWHAIRPAQQRRRWRKGASALLSLSLLLCGGLARADEHALESAPLYLANRSIVTLRGPIAGYTARERVDNVARRLDDTLARHASPAVTLEEAPEGTRVLVGGERAFVVTGADIDPIYGETTALVAQASARRLEEAIVALREQQTPRYLARAIGLVVLASALCAFSLRLLLRAARALSARLTGVAARHGQRFAVEGVELLETTRITRFAEALVRGAVWLIAAAATAAWLAFALSQFPYTRPWGEGLLSNLLGILRQVALAVIGALPGLVVVGLIIVLARGVIHMAALLFDRVERGSLRLEWMDQETVRPTRRLFAGLVWGFALAMAYPYIPGSSSEAFKGLSVLVGVMISLGGSSLIGRAAAGLTLMYSRAFRRGDYVRIDATEGTVQEVGMFSTQLRTGLGEVLTIPNSMVVGSVSKNYSRAAVGMAYLVDTAVTIGYGTPWRQVEAMLIEAARRTRGITPEPAPFVRQAALSDFYVEYRLAALVPSDNPPPRLEVLDALHANVQDVFNEYGVQIMSPHYEADPSQPQVVPRQSWYAAPARPATNGGEVPRAEPARLQARER